MERFILVFFNILICVSVGFAQAPKELKGPRAKNYKIWKDNSEPSVPVFQPNKEKLIGPKAKNRKPWEKNQAARKSKAISSSKRPKLTGPRAKNWKPWSKRDRKETQNTAKSSKRKSDKKSKN